MQAFLLLYLFCIGSVGASHFFVTAPNVLRFNQDEKVLVNVFSESNFGVQIWLQIGTRAFSRKHVNVMNDAHPSTTTIKVTENDLFTGNDDTKKPTEVTLHARTARGTFSRKLLLSYNTGYIIMHTSKPMYHPRDNVHVRALAMTEDMKYAEGWNISMDIISPSNLTFGRKSKVGNAKFFEDAFTLPPHAETGLWTIKAFYMGQYSTEGRTNFQVQEYVLPTFGVKVDVTEKVILNTTDEISIIVDAQYVYKKPVKGRAVLKISCLASDGTSQSLSDTISKNLGADGTTLITDANLEKLKGECGGFPALDGQRLHVSAQVVELATGHAEIGSYKQTVFSLKKYIINFENSKKIYRPGLTYYLRVSIKLANGDDPGELDVEAKWNLDHERQSEKTNEQGNGLMLFTPSRGQTQVITFNVMTNEQSEEFNVEVYNGVNQIQIEQMLSKDKMILEATVQGIGNTGIMSVFISRGRYIDHIYFPPATNPSKVIPEDIQRKIAPEARVVGFFITNQGQLVADSTKFSLKHECLGPGLKLETDLPTYNPNDVGTLTISGSPGMGVGLNIMDKALLLMDNNNVLRKSKMFEMMKSHDLGCGEGGGSNAELVFRDAGLTVVTNAYLNANVLDRKKIECESQQRKKRSLECSSSAKPECCNLGFNFAVEVLRQHELDEDAIDPYTTCHGRTIHIARIKDEFGHNKYSYACLVHHFKKCVDELYSANRGDIIAKSALDLSSEYVDALNEYNLDIDDFYVRKDFKDSWLFKSVDLNDEGKSAEIELNFPSSITDWMIQAIGITEDQGLCISEPHNVTAFMPFFIQLDMPYKACRLEYFEIKVTIFNYGNRQENANVKLFIAEQKGLCTGFNSQEAVADIKMKTNDAYNVRIPILALEAGLFPIKITAMGRIGARSVTDAIEKELLVVNEGVEVREAITVCLNPVEDELNTDCSSSDRVSSLETIYVMQSLLVNLTLPHNAIKDTGSAFGYASSNVIDDVVRTILSGIDHMLRQPTGCGEQAMINLGPSVYVMSYWKKKGQLTYHRRITGKRMIRDGIKLELTYRKTDGSYACVLSRPSSTWLTAFVAKVFCQAEKVMDNTVHINVVKTISWLEGKMNQRTGMFNDENPVSSRSLMGQVKLGDPSLTAFVLITLSECGYRTSNYYKTKRKAMQYLESIKDYQYRQHPYLLAISTYALALANSPAKYRFRNTLLDIGRRDRRQNLMYWGYPGYYHASKDTVETTAYAMLALMQFPNSGDMVLPVARWLTSQRSAAGSFRTTQDTIIGLQALSEYTIKKWTPKVKLDVSLSAPGFSREQQLDDGNRYLLETIKGIPVRKGEHFMTVTAKGEGSGRFIIDYRYNRQQLKDEKCGFNISKIIIEDVKDFDIKENFTRKCDVCGFCEDDNEENDDNIANFEQIRRMKRNVNDNNPGKKKQYCVTLSVSSLNDTRHGMSIIDVGLETGMHVVQADLEEMQGNGLIDDFEMPQNQKGFFILYLFEITSKIQKFRFRLEDHFEGDSNSRQPTRVQVYDYYKPEFECIRFYSSSGSSAVVYNCGSEDGNKKDTCYCLQKLCPSPDMTTDIIKKAQAKLKPAELLEEITCDFTRANFAVLMNVTSLAPDMDQQLRTATAVIVKTIHQGSEEMEPGTEIDLYWRMYCPPDLFEKDKLYYLISMDGERSRTKNGITVYKYQLMGSTIVVEWNDTKGKLPKKEGFLQKIMNVYERKMKDGCPN